MAKRPLAIGLIGAGTNTCDRHIPGFLAQSGVTIRAVANRTPESAAAVAARYGIATVHPDWRALLADPLIEAVCIGTWPDSHSEITLAALAAGKHVLCEARMARDAAEAHRMLAAASARPDLVAQLVPSPFTLGIDETIRDAIVGGRLGRMLAVDLVFRDRRFVDPSLPLHWRQDRSRSGFNVLALGIVYEALMRWIGPAERVIANSRVFVPRRRDADGAWVEVTVPDHVDVLADFAGGAVANLRFSGVTGGAPADEAWVFGDAGTLRIEFGQGRVSLAGRSDGVFTDISPAADARPGWNVEAEFVSSIREGIPVRRTSFADGVRYMEFTEAVARAAATGRAVSLPLA